MNQEDLIEEYLKKSKTIAVVGCSSDTNRTSRRIAGYLKKAGFRILPVNPNEDKILGEHVYNAVQEIPENIQVDIVNIFRNNKYTADMVRDAVDRFGDSESKPLIWAQLNVSSEEAMELARENGFPYIKNRCIYVEHRDGNF